MDTIKKISLDVHLKPNAKSNEVTSYKNNKLYVKVTAPPHKGEANKALLKLLVKTLSIPKSSLDIAHGHTNPNKVIYIEGLTMGELKDKLSLALDKEGTVKK